MNLIRRGILDTSHKYAYVKNTGAGIWKGFMWLRRQSELWTPVNQVMSLHVS
jgi:hypothetical protein